MNAIAPELLDLLVCPRCRQPVRPAGPDRLTCAGDACGLSYPVRDGIPVMLIEEAGTAPGNPDSNDPAEPAGARKRKGEHE